MALVLRISPLAFKYSSRGMFIYKDVTSRVTGMTIKGHH